MFRELDSGLLLTRKGDFMLDLLEEEIGDINSAEIRNQLESVFTRLVSVGISPEESVYLIATVWDLAIEDGYSPDV